MATIVVYNQITLYNVVTREWDQEVCYDDSNTDVLYNTFRMRFEGLIHTGGRSYSTVAGYTPDGADVANIHDRHEGIHRKILQPRALLSIGTTDNAGNISVFFQCSPCGGANMYNGPATYPVGDAYKPTSIDHDVANGPKPKSFRILQVIGNRALRVAFEIECSKLVCESTSGSAGETIPPVLNNRWSVEEGMDENQFITRTISGRMRLSKAAGNSGQVHKYLVVPGLERGFRRAALNYSVTPDGLACEYRVIDRQVHTAAPWPATKMNARYTQATNDGLTMTAEVNVFLEGPPGASKRDLFARAMQIIDAKLHFEKMLAENGKKYMTQYIPEHISFTEHIGDSNQIEAAARFLLTPGDEDLKTFFAIQRAELGNALVLPDDRAGRPYDPSVSDAPPIYGYNPPVGDNRAGSIRSGAVFAVLQCYLQKPCYNVHGISGVGTYVRQDSWVDPDASTGTSTTQPPQDSTGGTAVEEVPDGSIPYDPQKNNWSDDARSSVYTFSAVSSQYVTKQNIVQLPVAGVSGAGPAAQAAAAQAAGSPDAARSSERTQIESGPTQQSYDTCKMFRLAGPSCRRMIDMDVERAGDLPDVASPLSTFSDGINGSLRGTLIEHSMVTHPPCLAADGVTPIYRISIHYVYAMNRAPYIGESYRLGVAPQTKFKRTDKEVQFEPSKAFMNPELDP